MKKQELKEQLFLATHMLRYNAEILQDTEEALRRRRILYDRLANHSTMQKPKSMNEMAEDLYIQYMIWFLNPSPGDSCVVSKFCITPFKDLEETQRDFWMDRLLTILN